MNSRWRSKIEEACRNFAGRGERVLGFADVELDPELYQDFDGEKFHMEVKSNYIFSGLFFDRFYLYKSICQFERQKIKFLIRRCQRFV